MTREPQSPSWPRLFPHAVNCFLVAYSRRADKRNLVKAGFTLTHILRDGKFIMAGNSWLQKLEAANHNPSSDRKWREGNTGAQLTHNLLIQSRTLNPWSSATHIHGRSSHLHPSQAPSLCRGGWMAQQGPHRPFTDVGWVDNQPPSKF